MADTEFEFRRGYHYGVAEERQRVLDWVEENRSLISLGDKESIARDHFDSESLIAFIESENQVSAFNEDLAQNLLDPEFALAYGAEQKQLQIIKLLSDIKTNEEFWAGIDFAIALIKGEVK